jgi:hypothetical protein
MLLIMNMTQSSEVGVTERTVGKAREQRGMRNKIITFGKMAERNEVLVT